MITAKSSEKKTSGLEKRLKRVSTDNTGHAQKPNWIKWMESVFCIYIKKTYTPMFTAVSILSVIHTVWCDLFYINTQWRQLSASLFSAYLAKCTDYGLLTSFYLSLLESSRKILAAPVLLRVVLHRAAVRFHLLIEAAAVNQHRLAALRVPAALAEHLLQLLDGVTALPLPNAVLLHAAIASP